MTVLQEQRNSYFFCVRDKLTTAQKTLKSGKTRGTLNNKQTLNYVNLKSKLYGGNKIIFSFYF